MTLAELTVFSAKRKRKWKSAREFHPPKSFSKVRTWLPRRR